MMNSEKLFEWYSSDLYEGKGDFILIVLNTKVLNEARLIRLWNKAKFRVTVDGGTNRWHQIISRNRGEILNPNPDLITGDLDSIDPQVLKYYQEKDCKIVKTPDQNYTDFTKAVQEVCKLDIPADSILAFAEHNGRLDQIFGIFETLFHVRNVGKPVYVASSTSLEWLLHPGEHSIYLPQNIQVEKLHCGLIPLGEPCPGIKTSGFKWNLEGDQILAFGHLVSTSNRFAKGCEKATISTYKPLLFTMELVQEE